MCFFPPEGMAGKKSRFSCSTALPRDRHSQSRLGICGEFMGSLRLFPFSLWGENDLKSLLLKLQSLRDSSVGNFRENEVLRLIVPAQ